MVDRKGGARRKTRNVFKKARGQRGKINIRRYLSKYTIGDNVCLLVEPAVHKGVYFRRFHGRVGTITGQQGTCYIVSIHEGSKTKNLIVHPVHLQRRT